MKKILLLTFLSLTIILTSISTSGLFSYQKYDLANNEEPYPFPTTKR